MSSLRRGFTVSSRHVFLRLHVHDIGADTHMHTRAQCLDVGSTISDAALTHFVKAKKMREEEHARR